MMDKSTDPNRRYMIGALCKLNYILKQKYIIHLILVMTYILVSVIRVFENQHTQVRELHFLRIVPEGSAYLLKRLVSNYPPNRAKADGVFGLRLAFILPKYMTILVNFWQFLSDEEDTDSISSLIENYDDPVSIQIFNFISSNFRPLTEAVTMLQSRQSLVESLNIVQQLRSDLTLDTYQSKLKALLKKNLNLQKFILSFQMSHPEKRSKNGKIT